MKIAIQRLCRPLSLAFGVGGLTKSGDLIKKPIVEAMNNNVLPLWRDKVKVEFSKLKEADAAILGASALAWEL